MEELEDLARNIGDIKSSMNKLANGRPANIWPQNASGSLNIKPFSGDPDAHWTNIDEFVTQFGLVAKALSWSTETQAAMLPLYLTGHAKETYHAMYDEEKDDIDRIWGKLRRAFRTPGMDSFIGIQLRSRKQGVSESVAQFVTDIKRLSRLAFSDHSDDTRETMAREAFIAGLLPNLKSAVLRSGTKILEEAVSIASKEELTQRIMNSDTQTRGTDVAALTASVERLVSTLQIPHKPQPRQHFQYNPRPTAEWTTAGLPRCYKCGRPGHIWRLCPENNFRRQHQVRPTHFDQNYSRFRPSEKYTRYEGPTHLPRYQAPIPQPTPATRDYSQGYNQRGRGHTQTYRRHNNSTRNFVNSVIAENTNTEQTDYTQEDQALLRALREDETHQVAFCDFTMPQIQNSENKNSTQTPSQTSKNTSIKWLLLCFLLIIQLSCSSAKAGLPMLCQTDAGVSTFKFPTETKCPKLPQDHTQQQNMTLELYKQNIIKYASKGYHCIITKQVTETFTYLFGDHNLKRSQTTYLPVSDLECDSMINTRTCSYGKMVTRKDHFTTARQHKWYYPGALWNCCRWKRFVTINCVLIPIQVFKRHSDAHMEASFGTTNECTYHKGKCKLRDNSFLIWKPRNTN